VPVGFFSPQAYFLKQAAADDGAVCLDGTPGAYYFRAGSDSTKWYIHHQGGGWCESPEDCLDRSTTDLGSSSKYPATASLGGGYFSQDPAVNPMMSEWNAVFIRYCDGGSFSGNNASTLSVGGKELHMRGHHILRAVMADLFANRGLTQATDVVISGCSAGGLATYLHTDEWRQAIQSSAKVVGLPDSGFFLDVQEPTVASGVGSTVPGNYHDGLRWVYSVMNATSGVNQACIAAHKPTGDDWMCMFAEHTAPHISTPIFALQSKYDKWQAGHVLGQNTIPLMNAMGRNITGRLEQNLINSSPVHGAFLDGCYHHCGEWGEILPIDGDEQSTAFLKFYYNITTQRFWNQDVAYPCDDCCLH